MRNAKDPGKHIEGNRFLVEVGWRSAEVVFELGPGGHVVSLVFEGSSFPARSPGNGRLA
jgi:hypothetical protein